MVEKSELLASPLFVDLPDDQIEWFINHLPNRDRAIISVHTHNDRGTGVAATELAMLAGAERV